MKHYLNVCDVNGAKVEPVDVITFGSPCQDLSVAGKRAGLKHESNGDEETTRSGLFMEAIRIIKEMREEDGIRQLRSGRADGHIRPRFAVWENVPGAFSSNKGEDFRVVLEELARIKDTEISIPMPEKGKWKTAGEIVGDGWSIAWRTLDAQYHGVPQRRRRIFLVADFADECAGEILFECKGLPGYPSESREEGQGIAGDFAKGIRGTGEGNGIGFDGYNQAVTGDVSKAITSAATDADHVPLVFQKINTAPYTLQIRSGCEGGGKGALIQTDKSACLTAAQTQTLFQPVPMESGVIDVETEVYVRRYEVDCKSLCECLRDHKSASGFSNKEIAEQLNVPLTKVEHWFRQDDCFAIPDADVWYQLKELLGITTDEFDEPITTFIAQEGKYDMSNRIYVGNVAPTLTTQSADYKYLVPLSIENHPNDSRIGIREDGTVQALTGRMGTGGGNVPLVAEPWTYQKVTGPLMANSHPGSYTGQDAYSDMLVTQPIYEPVALHNPSCAIDASYYKGPGERNGIERNIVAQPVFALDRASFNQGENAQYDFQINDDGIAHTLVARGPGAVCYHEFIKYIVRRLTPTECARLQGMPDEWCRLSQIDDMSDEDYEFWKQAHKTYAEINGKTYKEKTKIQMIKWYNKLQSDSPEYKAYGNGMALHCVRVPIHGIAKHGAKTMASLFDGIGDFPLAGLIDGIETLWTSEIELFPVAVTMERFREYEKHGCFSFGFEYKNLIEKEKKEMELKIKEITFPEVIDFNFDELKKEITDRVEMYKNLVYTEDQVKQAKTDRANLNKFVKVLSDERIKVKKQCMQPYEAFEQKVNELSKIVQEPIRLIDEQIKGYEDKQKEEKENKIHYMINESIGEDSPLDWLEHSQIFDSKWLNVSVSMKAIQDAISTRLEQIKNDLDTLSNLPEFGFEAAEVYKSTLDVNKAVNEARRMSEVAKAKAQHEAEIKAMAEEQERLAAELEAKKQAEQVSAQTGEAVFNNAPDVYAQIPRVEKQWISFSALLTTEDALALKEFFNSRNIEFKAV